MKKNYKLIRNSDADYDEKYAVELILIDEYGYSIDYGIDYEYFDTEEQAEKRINNYNKKLILCD
jgi:hypothetical protein